MLKVFNCVFFGLMLSVCCLGFTNVIAAENAVHYDPATDKYYHYVDGKAYNVENVKTIGSDVPSFYTVKDGNKEVAFYVESKNADGSLKYNTYNLSNDPTMKASQINSLSNQGLSNYKAAEDIHVGRVFSTTAKNPDDLIQGEENKNSAVSGQGTSGTSSGDTGSASTGNGQATTGNGLTPSSAVSFDEAAISNAVSAAVAAEAGSSFYDVKRTRCMSDEMYNDAVKWMNDYKTEALKIVASNTDTYQRALASTGSSDIVPPMGAMTNVIRDAKMNGGQSVHSSTAGYLISSPQAVSYANTGVAPSNTSGPSAGSFSTNAVYAEIFASLDSANGGGAYAAAFSAYAAGNQNGVFTAFGNAGITGPNIAAALAAVADAKADDDAEKAAAAAAAAEAASSL